MQVASVLLIMLIMYFIMQVASVLSFCKQNREIEGEWTTGGIQKWRGKTRTKKTHEEEEKGKKKKDKKKKNKDPNQHSKLYSTNYFVNDLKWLERSTGLGCARGIARKPLGWMVCG